MKKIVFSLTLLSLTCTLKAQWSNNPAVNNAICTAADDQNTPQIISDGNGGAIITWSDGRNGTDNNIYAQRIDASGNILWSSGGVAVCGITGDQNAPMLVSDGAGGAIIAWEDYFQPTSDIYAQRINSSGVPQWTLNGVAICSASESQNYLDIIADGAGGAIMTWEDSYGSSLDIYIQKVNSSGVTQWVADGIPICTATGEQYTPKLAPDGSGGAIITWEDHRGADPDIYAQHINSAGVISGTADGLVICNSTGEQYTPSVYTDGAGGALFAWQDKRNGNWDIYAQKITSGGAQQWGSNGVAITSASADQTSPKLINDQNGGAIFIWQQLASGANDIYAQRVNALATPLWTATGVEVCTASGEQYSPEIIADNSGGAIITWSDNRNFNTDIYAQKLTSSGEIVWSTNGAEISTADNNQNDVRFVSDGNDGAIFTWYDSRNTDYNIYAQNVCASGWLGVCSSSISNETNPSLIVSSANNMLAVQFNNINTPQADLTITDATGKTIFTQNKVNTQSRFELNTSAFASGIYIISLQSATAVYSTKFFVN